MARRGQSTSDKFHQRKKELSKKDLKRQKDSKNKIPDVIIACEDSESAPTYFRKMVEKLKEDKSITPFSLVIADHKHTNPNGVLQDLKNHKKDGKTYKNFDHKWIIIDRDIERVNGGGHSAEDFNNALSNAKKLKVEVAYSNDAFELWYLLHFQYRDTAILRDELLTVVIAKLKELSPHKFSKLDSNTIKSKTYIKHIFDELLSLQTTAIQNANRLHQSYQDEHNPEQDNPCTTIYRLVQLLNTLHEK